MKKKHFKDMFYETKARKVIASVLVLSAVLSSSVYAAGTLKSNSNDFQAKTVATANTEEKVTTFVNGDINEDGKVTLEDAQLALKGALKIVKDFTDAQLYAADVDSNGKVELTDAQLILKQALRIQSLPEKELPKTEEPIQTTTAPAVSVEPVVSEDVVSESPNPVVSRKPEPTGDISPSRTPRPSLKPVPAETENIVMDYKEVELKNANQAQFITATGVGSKEYKQYVLGPMTADEISPEEVSAEGVAMENILSSEGMEMKNPLAGREDLREKVIDVVRTERINGKPTVWELTGAALVTDSGLTLQETDIRVTNAEPQGHVFCDQENIDYTIPEWTKGVSFSFWAQTDTVNTGTPIFTINNDQFIFSVMQNGTVRFLDVTSAKERNSLYLQSDQIVGGYGHWSHYTITIKNDWVQVYVNGQENVYTKVSMNRSLIQGFNDGFLTRYNPITVVTQEMVDQDIRKYYTGIDSTGHTPWYYNIDTGAYEGHDDFSIFVNKRFGGGGKGDALLMDLLTDDTAKLWIGGSDTAIEPEHTNRQMKRGVNVADIRVYEMELTPEQVSACYAYTTELPDTILWDINKVELSTDDRIDVNKLPIVDGETGKWAEYDADTDVVTFKAPEGEADRVSGVELVNPFAGKIELRESLVEALSGQSIFPYLKVNGGTIEANNNDAVGCTAYGSEVMRGNFYDVWYGDPAIPGDQMEKATGTKNPSSPVDSIMSLEELEETYGDQKVEYHRPAWSNGLSVSFWAKPVEVDDSPILTFYKAKNMLLVISVRGDVVFYSLDGDNWRGGSVAANAEPYNSFTAMGDGSYVNEGQWNYYTVTFANDWIQVYVNGKEMVYTEVNLNRQTCKYFNKGYLTRYNPIGHWTTTMIEEMGDPSGTTLEGTPRNYLTKSGYLYDLTITDTWTNPSDFSIHSALSSKGFNNSMDSIAIRQTGVYANPFFHVNDSARLLIDYMTDSKVKMYFGGTPSTINLESKYMLQDLKMTMDDADSQDVRSKVHFNDVLYKTTQSTDENGNVIEVATDEQVMSRCKFLFSDHLLDEGTQMTGLVSYDKLLSPEEVAAEYASAKQP